MRELVAKQGETIVLGVGGEKSVQKVLFPVVTKWTETYGSGTFKIRVLMPDLTKHNVTPTIVDDNVVWTIGNSDTNSSGDGECCLIYEGSTFIAKSIYKIHINNDEGSSLV